MSIVRHKQIHEQLGIPEAHAIVQAFPDTPQVYCSPIAGDPDTGAQQELSLVQHYGTGFLMPGAGVLTEIHFVAQGNAGNSATARNIRWCVTSVVRDDTAATGLAVGEVLATDVAAVAGTAAGDVTLASGLTLAVPSQFMVFLKQGYTNTATEQIRCQNLRSGGPIPGVVGVYNAGIISAAQYMAVTVDTNTPTPNPVIPGDGIIAATFKGLAVYVKWRGA